jgi:hypothetical protein
MIFISNSLCLLRQNSCSWLSLTSPDLAAYESSIFSSMERLCFRYEFHGRPQKKPALVQ